MIVTVTPNPAIDVTLTVDTLQIGEVNRTTSKHRDPAGKGINVSRALSKNGHASIAVFPADPINGAWIVGELAAAQVESSTTPIGGEVRNNITIVDDNGETTKINEPGPAVTRTEIDALLTNVEAHLADSPSWLVAAGSLPIGLGAEFFVELGNRARHAGVRFAVDTSGSALTHVVEAGICDLIKPNIDELSELVGRELTTVGHVVEAARGALPHGEVLVSLGANGALLVTPDSVTWAGHPPVIADSTVGAGDSALAGYLSASQSRSGTKDHHAALATAVAWGTAAVTLPATTVPGPTDIDVTRVVVVSEPNQTTEIKELRV